MNKEELCEAEVKKNLVLAEIGEPLTLPLATLNRSCKFKEEWYRIQNKWHGLNEFDKAKQKAYSQTPEAKAYQKAYRQTPEAKAKRKAYYRNNKEKYIKDKQQLETSSHKEDTNTKQI